jgi:hypothetical protein
MAGTNLDISISANTDKARADLELLKGKLSLVNKEIRDLRTAGAKAGDTLPSAALQAASARANALSASITTLNRSLTQTGATMDWVATKPMRKLLTQFGSMEKTVKNLGVVLGGTLGGFAAGFVAGAAISAIQQFIDAISDAHKRLLALRDEAEKTGQAPAFIEAARRIAERAGRPQEDADKVLTGVAEAFRKVRTEAGAAIGPINTLKGNTDDAAVAAKNMAKEVATGVNAMHGARTATFDVAQAYDLVGVKLSKYKDNQEGEKQATIDTIKGFVNLARQGRLTASQLDAISKELFKGTPADAMLKMAPQYINQLNNEIAKLQQKLPVSISSAEELEALRGQQRQSVRDMFGRLNEINTEVELVTTKWTNAFIEKTLPKWGRDIKEWGANFWPQLTADWDASWATMNENWLRNTGETLDQMLARWGRYFQSLLEMAQRAYAAISAADKSVGGGRFGDPSIPAMPLGNSDDMGLFAAGGRVRGPGTGTSDSILARLSNGEFVMRAAAVNHWGPRFMAALNNLRNPFGNYATGGLVHRLPAFAAGGLVTTAGGTPVHLHLDGQAFPLRADNDVADSLLKTARAKQLLSAGRKPSWAGGRRYGG